MAEETNVTEIRGGKFIMNKRGFIELNWTAFLILMAVGAIVVMIALKVWSAQDFDIGNFTKIAMIVAVPIAAGIFTKLWFDD